MFFYPSPIFRPNTPAFLRVNNRYIDVVRNLALQLSSIFESEGILLVFDFEWLEFGAKPRRIRYCILFRFALEIIISMRALRVLMKFPIFVVVFEGIRILGNVNNRVLMPILYLKSDKFQLN